jgi:hypothetical protein
MWRNVWRRDVDAPLSSLDLATMGKRKQPEAQEPTRASKRKRAEAPQQEEQPAPPKGRAQQYDDEDDVSEELTEPDFYDAYGFPRPGSIASYREEDQAKLEQEATWEMEILLNLAGILRDPADPCVLFLVVEAAATQSITENRNQRKPRQRGKERGRQNPSQKVQNGFLAGNSIAKTMSDAV